jgi:hypothetical protein
MKLIKQDAKQIPAPERLIIFFAILLTWIKVFFEGQNILWLILPETIYIVCFLAFTLIWWYFGFRIMGRFLL